MGTVTYFILHRVNYTASIYLAPWSGNTSSVLSLQSSTRLWNLRSSSQKLNLISSLWIFFSLNYKGNITQWLVYSSKHSSKLPPLGIMFHYSSYQSIFLLYFVVVVQGFSLFVFCFVFFSRDWRSTKKDIKSLSPQFQNLLQKDKLPLLTLLQLTWSASFGPRNFQHLTSSQVQATY